MPRGLGGARCGVDHSPSPAAIATVERYEQRETASMTSPRNNRPLLAPEHNSLGTGSGDMCRAPQGYSGRLKHLIDESRKAA